MSRSFFNSDAAAVSVSGDSCTNLSEDWATFGNNMVSNTVSSGGITGGVHGMVNDRKSVKSRVNWSELVSGLYS